MMPMKQLASGRHVLVNIRGICYLPLPESREVDYTDQLCGIN